MVEKNRGAAAAGGTRTTRPRAKRSAGGDGIGEDQPPKTGRGAAGSRAAPRLDLQKDLRDFASARPSGWSHGDWLTFLESLGERGHNVTDRDAIGLALEKERLDIALSGIKGIGPQRRKALVEEYGNVWSLRTADPDDVARVAGIKRDAAERIQGGLS